MIKKILIALLIGIVVGGGIGAYIWFKPKPSAKNMEADLQIDAMALVASFKANPKMADSTFNNSLISVSGKIEHLETKEGMSVADIKIGDAIIQCQILKGETSFKEGQDARLKGFYIGYDDLIDLTIQLKDCVPDTDQKL